MDTHGINPRDIQPTIGEPINKLFWAVNHYISTGDHIGEGVARREGDHWLLTLVVNAASSTDLLDMGKLVARLAEIDPPLATLTWIGQKGDIHGWALGVADTDITALTEALTSQQGPEGWGSGKAVIDRYTWRHEP